jgi:pimeloyl-ACP methyl ester carboxylesterase
LKEIEIAARGMTFQALSDGPEDGPLLLLLHGLPRNRWEWHHQIPPMAKLGFRVVAPDLRGFCPGARPEGVEAYHVKEYAQDVLEIADALGHAGRPFHLMGTSIGASMAWWLAAKHPDRVATLVCINIPHPGALAEGRKKKAEAQKDKFSYFREARCGFRSTVILGLGARTQPELPIAAFAPVTGTWNSTVRITAVPFWHQPFQARQSPAALFHAG